MVSPLLGIRIARAVSGRVHGCLQGLMDDLLGRPNVKSSCDGIGALLPCLRPETSSWAGSGCTGRHDGPATARSKGAVPGSTGASNSKLSVASPQTPRRRDPEESTTPRRGQPTTPRRGHRLGLRLGPRRGEATTNAVRTAVGRSLRRRRGALRVHRVAVAGPRRAARRRDGVRLFNRRAPARDQIRDECCGRSHGRRHRAARPGL